MFIFGACRLSVHWMNWSDCTIKHNENNNNKSRWQQVKCTLHGSNIRSTVFAHNKQNNWRFHIDDDSDCNNNRNRYIYIFVVWVTLTAIAGRKFGRQWQFFVLFMCRVNSLNWMSKLWARINVTQQNLHKSIDCAFLNDLAFVCAVFCAVCFMVHRSAVHYFVQTFPNSFANLIANSVSAAVRPKPTAPERIIPSVFRILAIWSKTINSVLLKCSNIGVDECSRALHCNGTAFPKPTVVVGMCIRQSIQPTLFLVRCACEISVRNINTLHTRKSVWERPFVMCCQQLFAGVSRLNPQIHNQPARTVFYANHPRVASAHFIHIHFAA